MTHRFLLGIAVFAILMSFVHSIGGAMVILDGGRDAGFISISGPYIAVAMLAGATAAIVREQAKEIARLREHGDEEPASDS